MTLPPLRFSNVVQHMHQSFLVEMATPEDGSNSEEEETSDHDHGVTAAIQAAED